MPIAEANGGIANYCEGNLVRRLAHHKLSRRCYSIGNRSERYLDSSAEKVDASSEVFDWFETCTADRKARRPQPHRAHSTIDNYDSHVFSRPSSDRLSDFHRRQIRISRPEHDRSLRRVLSVDPGIRNSVPRYSPLEALPSPRRPRYRLRLERLVQTREGWSACERVFEPAARALCCRGSGFCSR